jgi:hypothetical protein
MTGHRRCLSLVKGPHRFVFVFLEGTERELLAAFVDLANDPDSEFDWLDAAVLSYRLGQRIECELDPVA